MILAVVMRPEVLTDKIEDGRVHGRKVATWNTRLLPKRLTPAWTNRLYVASQGKWRGHFLLCGDVLWNPDDKTAPYALIFDPRRWTPIASVPAPSFRGWRYLKAAPETQADGTRGAGAETSLIPGDRTAMPPKYSPRTT